MHVSRIATDRLPRNAALVIYKGTFDPRSDALQIADRVFIVTGASSGLGAALARSLVDRGGRVALVARREDRIRALAQSLGPTATAIPIDITTAEAPDIIVHKTIEAFDRIDCLINAAGRGMVGRILDIDLDHVDETYELNFIAPLRLIQRIAPLLVEQGEGVIVNISSPVSVMGLTGIGGYATAKLSLNLLSTTLRRELWGSGVHVMLAFPGVMDSEFYDSILGRKAGEPIEDRPPARAPREVAEAIVRGITRQQRELWFLSTRETMSLRIMRFMGRFAPGGLDRGLSRPRETS